VLRVSASRCYTLAMNKRNGRRSEKAIIVEHLTKNFEVTEKEKGLIGSVSSLVSPKKKVVRALKEISFSINQGELIGFIGPNGAGKTTTLKILSGLLYPTAGFIQVLDYNPWDRHPEFLKQIAAVFGQKNQLWWDLPAIETFELNRAIYEIPQRKYEESLKELVELLEIKKLLNVQVRRLSLGQRMRLELVAALLHQPKILFLDEPTIGLDVVAQQKVRDFIYKYNKKDKATIMLTSHNMDDVIDLAKRVIVIDKGSILFDGDLKDLVDQFAREKVIRIYLSRETDFKKLEEIGRVKRLDYPQAVLAVPREASAIAAAEILQNFPVADLTIDEEPIEDIIRRVFKGEKVKTK
jgi:ABC-2 type transport system ATP-binding protein